MTDTINCIRRVLTRTHNKQLFGLHEHPNHYEYILPPDPTTTFRLTFVQKSPDYPLIIRAVQEATILHNEQFVTKLQTKTLGTYVELLGTGEFWLVTHYNYPLISKD